MSKKQWIKQRARWTLRYKGEIFRDWIYKPSDGQVEVAVMATVPQVGPGRPMNLGRYELCYDGKCRYSWTALLEDC